MQVSGPSFGDMRLEVIPMVPAHTFVDLMIYLPQYKILFADPNRGGGMFAFRVGRCPYRQATQGVGAPGFFVRLASVDNVKITIPVSVAARNTWLDESTRRPVDVAP